MALALLALGPAAGVSAAATTIGYDISWPQCGSPYPAGPAFGIVGVNRGLVFSPNPCLVDQLTWAGTTSAGLYANTGNPGPALSTHWPTGQTSPQVCSAATPDTTACAYDYGYNAAADSYADAVAAFATLGLAASPAGNSWWLDVETSNSWRSDVALNVAALSGAVFYFVQVAHVSSLGFYSTAFQWGVITGGTTIFNRYPSWVAGGAGAPGATANCAGAGFTGGPVTLVQYITGGFDADLRCVDVWPSLPGGPGQLLGPPLGDGPGVILDPGRVPLATVVRGAPSDGRRGPSTARRANERSFAGRTDAGQTR